MDLIATLKSHHRAVEKLVAEINDALTRGDIPTVKKNLGTLKTALLGHLALEDAQLYPGLVKAAERKKDEAMSATVTRFSTNMEKIGVGLKAFLTKYDGQEFQAKAFSSEWKNIVTTLSTRITAEECSLYPLYEKNAAGK